MYNCRMSHTIREKQKLLIRVRRLRGQVEAIERALEEESGCDKVMHLIAGVKGATSSLMAEVMEDHVRQHFVEVKRRPDASMADAAEQLIDVVHAYLKQKDHARKQTQRCLPLTRSRVPCGRPRAQRAQDLGCHRPVRRHDGGRDRRRNFFLT